MRILSQRRHQEPPRTSRPAAGAGSALPDPRTTPIGYGDILALPEPDWATAAGGDRAWAYGDADAAYRALRPDALDGHALDVATRDRLRAELLDLAVHATTSAQVERNAVLMLLAPVAELMAEDLAVEAGRDCGSCGCSLGKCTSGGCGHDCCCPTSADATGEAVTA